MRYPYSFTFEILGIAIIIISLASSQSFFRATLPRGALRSCMLSKMRTIDMPLCPIPLVFPSFPSQSLFPVNSSTRNSRSSMTIGCRWPIFLKFNIFFLNSTTRCKWPLRNSRPRLPTRRPALSVLSSVIFVFVGLSEIHMSATMQSMATLRSSTRTPLWSLLSATRIGQGCQDWDDRFFPVGWC